MPNQRHQTHKYYCPHCQRRLWRVGSPKYFLGNDRESKLQADLNLSDTILGFLSSQPSSLRDRSAWLEEFFCEKDGKIWMHVARTGCGTLIVKPATRQN
jgi:hypothetical protein